MRWKELIIGGLIALVVTVIGGLIVFFFTQKEEIVKAEELRYQIGDQVSFEGSNNQASIGSLTLANIGNEPARNVVAKFDAGTAKIIEFKIDNKEGAQISEERLTDESSKKINIEALLPDEKLSVTYLLNQKSKIEFSVRSNKSAGTPGSIYKVEKDRNSILNNFFGDFIPLLIVLSAMPLIFIIRVLKSSSRGGCRNNIGFVLLHNGLYEEAKEFLEQALKNGDAEGTHALANYACLIAIEGDKEKAKTYLDSAVFLANSKHEHAICELCSAIISFNSGNFSDTEKSVREAIKLSKFEIKSYFKSSPLLRNIEAHENINLENDL